MHFGTGCHADKFRCLALLASREWQNALRASSRTTALSVFFASSNRMLGMRGSHTPYTSPKRLLWRLLLLGSALLAASWSLLADTPGRLKSTQAGGCYCRCSRAKSLGSCVKMCELPKFASRWWATSCAKSRSHYSGNNPGAGPRLRHRDRAEHARL